MRLYDLNIGARLVRARVLKLDQDYLSILLVRARLVRARVLKHILIQKY